MAPPNLGNDFQETEVTARGRASQPWLIQLPCSRPEVSDTRFLMAQGMKSRMHGAMVKLYFVPPHCSWLFSVAKTEYAPRKDLHIASPKI